MNIKEMYQNHGEDNTIEEHQPFVFHLYTECRVPAAAAVEADTDALEAATSAGVALIHDHLHRLEMIKYRKLPGIPIAPRTGRPVADDMVVDWLSGELPIRRSLRYDGLYNKYRVVLDILVRKVGNYYVRIINGPLHGQMLPLSQRTTGDYSWLEDKSFDYTDYDYEDEGNMITFPRLPDLNPKYVDQSYLQRYWIEAGYAYYLGDRLRRHDDTTQ